MKFATVRDFKLRSTQYLKKREEVYITRRGKPVAVLTPLQEKSPEVVLAEMGQLIKESGISRKDLLALLEEARGEIYHS